MGRPLQLDDINLVEEASDTQVHPFRPVVAYLLTAVADDDYTSHVRLVTTDADDRALTHGSRDVMPRWSPDGHHLAFLRAVDGAPQVFLLPIDGGEPAALTSAPLGVGGFVWSPDSRRLAVVALGDLQSESEQDAVDPSAPVVVDRLLHMGDGGGRRGPHLAQAWVVPLDGSTPSRVTDGVSDVGEVCWSPDGEHLVVVTARHDDRDLDARSGLWRFDLDGGEPVDLTPGHLGMVASPTFTTDGDAIVFAGPARMDVSVHTRLWRVPAQGGDAVALSPDFDRNVMLGAPGYPGAPPRIDADDRVWFCARDRGAVHLFTTPASGGSATLVLGGTHVVSSLSVASGRSLVAVTAADELTTPGVLLVDADDGTTRTLVRTSVDLLDQVSAAASVERTFTSPDGTEVHGWLFGGDTSTPRPLLLDIHGGPHNAWGPAFDPVHLYHQVLVDQGWAVLVLNPRGSDGYGEAFYSSLTGGWGRFDGDDFLTAVDELVSEGVADPDRLAVTGYSYGGYATCWLTTQTDRFAAAVPGGLVCDLASFAMAADVGPQITLAEFDVDPAGDLSPLADQSPITHVDAVTTPTLILHGADDLRCPVNEAERWFAALRLRQRTVQMVLYPGCSHTFILTGSPSNRIDYANRVIDWVTTHATSKDNVDEAP